MRNVWRKWGLLSLSLLMLIAVIPSYYTVSAAESLSGKADILVDELVDWTKVYSRTEHLQFDASNRCV
ncbi:hypothetical protein BK133_25155 [Paenibacillus sp. FSL H8-0548]|uniref:hypothetical protein n=1 Tax=Paenibacillus sp. FSL H8-0548 TaxID=1920422 RepID=UPI00096EDBB5|nr:hypothetical protein [Paenibacillus sp. FSL H8-0548]OMF22943.1 hypothetical protein BK133_25155 [Paenibacillus sp. FSL H8-0548]